MENTITGNKFLQKYPDMIPIMIEFRKGSLDTMVKTQKRVKHYMTCSEFIMLCRKTIISKDPQKSKSSYFFHVGNYTIVGGQTTMKDLYDKYKNKDGILQIYCSEENMFG
jgi:hypothetical protein